MTRRPAPSPSAWPIAGGCIRVGLVVKALRISGAARQVEALARHLDPARHDVRVYALSELGGPQGERLLAAGVRVVAWPRRRSWEPARLLALTRALRRDVVALVHTFSPPALLYGTLAARLAGVPTVIASARDGERWPGGLAGRLLAAAYRRATAVAVDSQAHGARLIARAGVSPERVRVIPDGVDLAGFPTPGRLDGLWDRVRTGPHVIGAAGPAATAWPLFVAAARHVLASEPQVRFVWLGGADDDVAHLEHAAHAEAIPVTVASREQGVAGQLSRLALLWVLGEGDDDAHALALAAMATARPVVATSGSGIEEIVEHEATGVLVAPGASHSLAERTLALLTDGNRRRQLGHAARLRAEREFALGDVVRSTAALYEQAILGRLDAESDAWDDTAATREHEALARR